MLKLKRGAICFQIRRKLTVIQRSKAQKQNQTRMNTKVLMYQILKYTTQNVVGTFFLACVNDRWEKNKKIKKHS